MIDKDRLFLTEEFPKFYKKTLDYKVLNAYYEAERIIKGYDKIKRRGCNCEYPQLLKEINKLYESWLQRQQESTLHNTERDR